MPERVAIFIDGANLLHSLSNDFTNIRIDFVLLTNKLLAIVASGSSPARQFVKIGIIIPDSRPRKSHG